MHKYILLIRGEQTDTYADFTSKVFNAADAIAHHTEPCRLKLTITTDPPPVVSIIPFKKKKIASVSVYDPKGDLKTFLSNMTGIAGSYEVTEALPVAYNKTWDDREQSPGVCLLTLFKQKKGLPYDTFIDRWHNSHTPLSLKLHPLWNYSRNVVDKKLLEPSQPWDGIVEEHFRTSSDLLNPFRFFGKPISIAYNMLQVYRDTKSFLDYKTIEPYLAAEYHLIS